MLSGIDNFLAAPLRALDLRAQRGEVLASNIANADTPNYKARDLDFASVLRGAMGTAQRVELARTSSRHLTGTGGSAPSAQLQYRVPVQPSIDGNTVELDTELAQFSENALRYQSDLTVMSSQIRQMVTAITGQ